MANQANVTVGVQIDNASYNATQRRILALVRNTPTINLKVSAAPLGRINADLHEFDKSLQAANARVIAFTASTSAIYGLSRAFLDITKTFIDVEARFKGIQVVLNTTTQKFEAFKSSVFDIARNTGKSFGEVAEAATELSRQGLRAEEVQNRLNAAMILSRQSGLDAAESVKALTAATNSFNKQALDQIAIVNKLANVDANFAVSSKDLVESLSRAGSAAQDAGIDFDKLISFTTSLQQTTARGGAVIGNALRSIFTRVERGSTLDSLQQFGVATKDLEGNVLSVDKVLKNLADTYKNLTRAEQAALSEKVAGIQQINQLKALLSDLSRGNSIYAQSLAVAGEETNSAIDRNKALNQTLQANLNAIKVTATQFSSVFGKLVFKPSIERGGGVADFFLGQLKNQDDQSKSAGQKIGEGFLKGVGQALAGPGLIIGASVLFNITKQLAGFAKNIILDYSSLNATTKQQANIQNAINQIIASGNSKYLERLARARSVREEEEAIKRIMLEVNGLQLQRGGQFYGGIKNVVRRGGGIGQDNGFIVPRASGGYLPVAEEAADIHRGVGGASRSARPKVIPNFNFGGGKRGTVVANTDEYIVPNFGGGDGSAIFNQQMVRKHGLPQGARKINAAGGLIPSYAKIKHQKFHGGAHRLETDSGSRLNYFGIEDEDGSFPDYAIDHIKSNKKGDAFKLFNQLAKRAKKGKRGIYSDILTSQSDRLYPGMHQDYSFEEIAEIAYPQLRYRNQKGLNTKLRLNYTSNDDAGQIFDMKDIGKHLKARYKTKQNFVNHASNGVSLHDVHTTVGKDFKGAAGGFVPNYNKSPRNLENLKAAKFRVVGKTFDSTIDYIATRNASVGKPYFEDDGNIQKAFRMTTVIDDDPIGRKTFDSMSEAVRAAKLSAKLKTSGRSKEFYKLEKPKYVSAAGGLIPNFAKLLGSGSYGSFYDLERKYKGVNLGKKIFTPDRDLKTKEEKFRPYQLRNIENEFIASKVLQNFSENGQLPSGVYAPKTFGSLSRALERKSFGKEVIKGIDGHKFAQRLKKQFIGHPEEFNVGDGVDSYVDSISSYLKNTLIDRGVETSDLHEGNYIISPELAYGLERHILSNPARAKALGEGSQSNFEDFFTNFLGKHSQHRVSIIDPGGISSSRVKDPLDFRKIAGLAGGYIPNYVKGGIGYHRTKKDFDKFELSKVDGKNGDVLGRAHYFANSMRDAKEYYNHIPANKIITALLDGEIFTPSQEKIKLGAAKKFVGLFKERHGKDVHKSYLREKFNSFKKGNFSNTGGGDTAIQALLQGGYSGVNDTGMTVMYKDDAINIIDKQNLAGGFIPNYSKVGIENISSKDFSKRELAKIKKLEKGLNSPSISKTFKFGGKYPISFGIFDSLSESTLSKDSSGAAAQFDYRTNTIGLSRETLKDNSVKDLSRIIGHEIAHGFQIDKFYKEKDGRVQGTFEAFGKLPKFNRSQTARVKKEIADNYTSNKRKELGANLYEKLIGREIYKNSRAAGGFIPNYADNLLTNIDDATGLEKLIARVFGFNLVNAKSNKHLKSQKLKGRLIDTTGDFDRYLDKDNPSQLNRALLSRKATKALVTSPRLLNIDKFDETQISKGLAESRLASDLFKKHGITPSQDKHEYAGQLNTVSALEFGDDSKVLFKDKNSLQGKGVFGGTGLYLAPALPKPEDFIIQKEIAPDEGTTSQQQFLKEYRVDIVGGRKGVFGGIPLLKRIGTLSDSNFKGKTNLHVNEKNNFRFLRHPIEAFRAVRQAYKTVNSIDPSKRAGAVFGADAFPEGAIELNPGTISGASGSQSRNFFSSLITGIGLRRASNENVDYFTNRGKDILKLSGKDQSKEFRGFTKELLELQKHDEFGYLKIAQNLNKLGYGLTIGKGKGKEQLGGGRASKLFSSLGLAGGYVPNYALGAGNKIRHIPLNERRALFAKVREQMGGTKSIALGGGVNMDGDPLSFTPRAIRTDAGDFLLSYRAATTKQRLKYPDSKFDKNRAYDSRNNLTDSLLNRSHEDSPMFNTIGTTTSRHVLQQFRAMGSTYVDRPYTGIYATQIDKIKERFEDGKIGFPVGSPRYKSKYDNFGSREWEREISQINGGNLIAIRKFLGGYGKGRETIPNFANIRGFHGTRFESANSFNGKIDPSISSGEGQGKGFYFYTRPATAISHAANFLKDNPGNPFVISSKFDQSKVVPDYEQNLRLGLEFLHSNPELLSSLTDIPVGPTGRQKLSSIKKNDSGLSLNTALGNYKLKKQYNLDNLNQEYSGSVGDAALIGPIMDKLRELHPDKLIPFEQAFINKAKKSKLPKALRYIGDSIPGKISKVNTKGYNNAALDNAAGGFMPNFCAPGKNPIECAIKREHAAGIPYSQIKIERSAALAAPHNPHGLAITNTRDEPGGIGQGIARALSEGKNPKTYGVPNFATPTPKFTAGEAANYGDNRNVSKSVRANVKDFIGAFDIPKKDLILPIDKLRKSITDSIATALKIDPRLVTAKQAAGFNKIAERIIRVNTQAINDAGLKEAQRQQALVQKQKQAQKDEVILNSYSNRLAQKAALENQKDTGFGGFLKGIGSSKRLQAESDKIIGFAKKAGLSSFELDKLKLQQSNILDSQKDRRRQRIQGAAFTASIGLPVVTNLATSLLPNTNPTGRKVNALGEAAGSGLSVAATLGFSPLGLALGAATTALIGFKGVADASRKSLDELTKETDDVRGNFENNKNSAASIFQGREQLTDLINKGASSQEINLVSSQIQELIGQIDDNGLSRKIINAKKPQDQFDIIAELSAKQVKAVSEKGLGVSLESIIGQKRDITGDFFDDTQNILLKKQERLDVTSLVKNALPLNTNEKKRNKQIEGLNNINDSGNFSLDELQKVLGNLNISPEVLKQFQQLASIEQEAIVKNVVQRNLSAEAIKKETESLKQYTQSVINIGRSLDKLQTATNFKFDLNNIKDSGTRVRALSGAGQSLNSLNDFITPETKNRFDNKLKTLENKDQNIKNITDISRGFINSFENLPSVIDDGLKNIQSGDNVKDSISSKSDKLKNDLQQLRAGLLDFGSKNNPVDTANFANSEINKLISSLTGKDPGINGPLIAAIEKFRSEGFTVPIELERAQDSERKALQENTNKINELTLSINKQLSFLGGRGFEELPSANFDKITAGLRQGKEIRESVNGPFSSRIYKSRGNKFDDFFKGQEIDVDAENSRKAKVFSTLASGKLQAYKEGLFNDNPELINQTRFEVAKAQEFRQTEVLQKLIKSAQNNGDVDFADQLRSQLPKVADNAALYAAKEVPFDQKDLTKPFGPEGAFKELSANLANLQKSFEAGVKGDFKSLLNSSSLAAKQLLDLSNITKQLNDLNKNTAKQSQLVDLNSQKKELEEQKRKLESGIIPDQQKKFNKDLNKEFLSDDKFYDRLPRSIADKVGLGAKGIERLSLSDKKGFLAPLTPGGGSELEAFASQLGLNPDDRKAKNAFGFFNKAAKSTKDDPFSSVDLINSLRKNFKDELKSDPDYVKKVISAQVRANSNNYSGISRNSLTDAPDVAGLQIESRLQGLDTALSNPFNDEKISQDELRSLNDRIKELEARQNEISNQATGYLPGFAGGLLKSIGKEQKAINLGVGGAKPGDKPYVANIKGIGPAVVNTGETIVRNFSGGKDAVLNRVMKQKMGFVNLAEGSFDFDYASQIADIKAFTADRAEEMFDKKSRAAFYDRSGKYSDTAAAKNISKAKSFKSLAGSFGVLGRLAGGVALLPSVYDTATTSGSEQAGNALGLGVNIAGIANPVFGTGSAIGGGISSGLLALYRKITGSDYGDGQFTLNPFADIAKGLPDVFGGMLSNYTTPNIQAQMIRSQELKKFNSTGKYGIPNYADGNLDIDINKLPEHLKRYGEGLVVDEDLDNLIKLYKKEGIAGLKNRLDSVDVKSDKLIVNKAGGFLPEINRLQNNNIRSSIDATRNRFNDSRRVIDTKNNFVGSKLDYQAFLISEQSKLPKNSVGVGRNGYINNKDFGNNNSLESRLAFPKPIVDKVNFSPSRFPDSGKHWAGQHVNNPTLDFINSDRRDLLSDFTLKRGRYADDIGKPFNKADYREDYDLDSFFNPYGAKNNNFDYLKEQNNRFSEGNFPGRDVFTPYGKGAIDTGEGGGISSSFVGPIIPGGGKGVLGAAYNYTRASQSPGGKFDPNGNMIDPIDKAEKLAIYQAELEKKNNRTGKGAFGGLSSQSQLNDFANQKRNNNFGGSKIFDDKFNAETNSFRSQFAGNAGYKGLDIQERIRTQGSAFKSVGLETSGGLRTGSLNGPQRYGASELTPEDNERDARKNYNTRQNRYNQTVGNPDSSDAKIQRKFEELEQKINNNNSNSNNQSNSNSSGPVDVNHSIKIEINGSINSQNAAAQSIIDEELATFKQRTQDRLAALESVNKNAPPVPPKIPTPA